MSASNQSGRTPSRPSWRWGYLAWGLCVALATVAASRLAGDGGAAGVVLIVVAMGVMVGMRSPSPQQDPPAPARVEAGPLPQRVLPIWMRQIDAARLHSQAGIEAMLESFATVSLQVDDPALHDELEKMALGLQSQDRVSQMLTAVTDDMQRLVQCLNGAQDPAAADPSQWLARLEASYPMEDMNARHHDQAVVEKASGVQFF